ncbi:TIGR01777 family oxidoreductase [Humidisolicoccus flavus]|uniref:TIGR01777 family oxidoreductase n=1 Tax=Humidisolicoccus flavus TaxID=3111414 RepID=UPI003244B859
MTRVLIAGASGLIGTRVQDILRAEGHEVATLVRRSPAAAHEFEWAPASGHFPEQALEGVGAVINLSGSSISKLPWTASRKAEILASRIRATTTITTAINQSSTPPALINGSAVGFYGNRPGETLTEESARGEGFLADVVVDWEAAASGAKSARTVFLRTGLVFDKSGGALAPLLLATKAFLGSSIGTGEQYWPWISLEDEARAIVHLSVNSALNGPVNLSAPAHNTAEEVSRELARQLHRPHLFTLPRFLLRAGLGTAADELLLADQRVSSQRLLDDGFTFTHPTLSSALESALRS